MEGKLGLCINYYMTWLYDTYIHIYIYSYIYYICYTSIHIHLRGYYIPFGYMLSKKKGIKLFQPGFLYQAELLVSDKSSHLSAPSLAVYRCVVFWMTGKKTFKKNVPQIGALPQSWTSTEKTQVSNGLCHWDWRWRGKHKESKRWCNTNCKSTSKYLEATRLALVYAPSWQQKTQEKSQGPLVRVGEKKHTVMTILYENAPELVEKMVILLPNLFPSQTDPMFEDSHTFPTFF